MLSNLLTVINVPCKKRIDKNVMHSQNIPTQEHVML